MDKAERIAEILNGMDDEDVMHIYNGKSNSDEIYPMCELENLVDGWSVEDLIELGASGFDTGNSFFKEGYYGFESGELWDFVDTDELAIWIVEDDDDCGFDEIREILDSEEMEDEVEEDDE